MTKKQTTRRKKRMGRLEDDPLYMAKPLAKVSDRVTPEDHDAIIYGVLSPSGRRWVSAPRSTGPHSPAVYGVMLGPDEDVQWSWTHTTNGSYVNGYTIVPRLAPRSVILS